MTMHTTRLIAAVFAGGVLALSAGACGSEVVVVDGEGGSGGTPLTGTTTGTSTGTGSFTTTLTATGTGTTTGTTTSTSTTTSTATATATATVTSTGTATGINCDGTGDCNSCFMCSAVNTCAFSYDTCINDFECGSYAQCLEQCFDDACVYQCAAQYPFGSYLYAELIDCVVCTDCPSDCSAPQFGCGGNCLSFAEGECGDGTCFPYFAACDGFPDCMNGADEAPFNPACGAGGCSFNEYQCFDGGCIPNFLACDQFPDCADGSDEAPLNPQCGIGNCDGTGICDNCTQCAVNSECQADLQNCFSNPDCDGLLNCLQMCPPNDPGCGGNCAQTFQGGINDYNALVDCVLCDACASDCSGVAMCPIQ